MFKAFKFRSMAKHAPFVPWTRPYDGIACAEDIFFCFRLLLGRHPVPEEWIGHSSRIGEELAPVVLSYLESLEFARRGLLQYHHPDIALVERENFKIFVYKGDPAIEPEVQLIFRSFLKSGMSVLDVGANLGLHTMYAASIVGPNGYVLAVEPSVKNVRLLEASRRHNGFDWVSVVQVAAGRQVGILVLNADSKGTTSQAPEALATLMGAEMATFVPLDILIPLERKIDFIRIDIEGAEYNALVGLQQAIQRCRPIIVSAFTPGSMPGISGVKGIEYLHWLIERDYRLGVIEKDGTIFEAFDDCELVMAKLRARDTDHIDIIAQPQLRR